MCGIFWHFLIYQWHFLAFFQPGGGIFFVYSPGNPDSRQEGLSLPSRPGNNSSVSLVSPSTMSEAVQLPLAELVRNLNEILQDEKVNVTKADLTHPTPQRIQVGQGEVKSGALGPQSQPRG